MDNEQKLIAEPIYRINAELDRIVAATPDTEEGPVFGEDVQLVPCAFDGLHRRIRWLSVARDSWGWNERLFSDAKKILPQLLPLSRQKRLGRFWPQPLPPPSKEAWNFGDEFTKDLETILKIGNYKGFSTENLSRQCHRALLQLVQGRSFNPDYFLEGLTYRKVKDYAPHRAPLYLTNTLLWGMAGDQYRFAPTRSEIFFVPGRSDAEPVFFSQDAGKFAKSEDDLEQLTVKNWSNVEESRNDREREWTFILQEAVFPVSGRAHRFISVPVCDGPYYGAPSGRLIGVVHAAIYGSKADPRRDARIYHAIERGLPRLAAAFRSGARARLAAAPLSTDDRTTPSAIANPAVRHFVRLLPLVQDYERVIVKRNDGDFAVESCWRRSVSADGEKKWEEDVLSQAGRALVDRLRCFELNESILRYVQFEWLTPEERQDLDKYSFRFELPDYTVVPASDNEALRASYLQEQLDLWQVLLPKVLLRRRAEVEAERTAAVAVISRNMSHNLGSHPIAKFADVSTLNDWIGEHKTHGHADVSRFFGYIRDRSDYIAELATSKPSWSLSYRLLDVVNAFKKQHVLLRHLGEANSGIKGDPDSETHKAVISLPHGVLGMQALFSIFENVLRNSMRHTGTSPHVPAPRGPVRAERGMIEIRATNRDQTVVLSIVDLGSIYADEKSAEATCEGIRKLLDLGFYRRDENSRSDTLERRAWGLKEMKISAAFLRRREARLTNHKQDPEGTPGYIDETATLDWVRVMPQVATPARPGRQALYRLCWQIVLLKPRTAMVMGSELTEGLPEQAVVTLERAGFRFSSTAEAIANGDGQELFLVATGAQAVEIERLYTSSGSCNWLPPRVIIVTGHDIGRTGFGIMSPDEWRTSAAAGGQALEEALYKAWNRHLWKTACTSGNGPMPLLLIANSDTQSSFDGETVRTLAASQVSRCAWLREPAEAAPFDRLAADTAPRPLIIYERHSSKEFDGLSYRYRSDAPGDWRATYEQKLWPRTIFYAGYEGGDDTEGSIILAPEQPVQSQRLIEAALTWVLVIDDRLASWAATAAGRRESELLGRAGVMFLPLADPAKPARADIEPEKIAAFIEKACTGVGARPGKLFVTIHHAILVGTCGAERALNWVRSVEALRPLFPVEVVVHSGRGTPAELVTGTLGGCKFVSFSNLDQWLRHPSCKPFVSEVLMSARAPRLEDRGEINAPSHPDLEPARRRLGQDSRAVRS